MRKSNHTINLDKTLDSDKKELLECICLQKLYPFFSADKIYRNKRTIYLRDVTKDVLLFLIASTNDSLYMDVTAKDIQTNLGISVHHCKNALNILQNVEIIKRIDKRGFMYHDKLIWSFKK